MISDDASLLTRVGSFINMHLIVYFVSVSQYYRMKNAFNTSSVVSQDSDNNPITVHTNIITVFNGPYSKLHKTQPGHLRCYSLVINLLNIH